LLLLLLLLVLLLLLLLLLLESDFVASLVIAHRLGLWRAIVVATICGRVGRRII
jgi:hypothetical protein